MLNESFLYLKLAENLVDLKIGLKRPKNSIITKPQTPMKLFEPELKLPKGNNPTTIFKFRSTFTSKPGVYSKVINAGRLYAEVNIHSVSKYDSNKLLYIHSSKKDR
jgi:hypothetical protein